MLEIRRVSKEYPTPRGPLHVLKDVSLSLAPGDAASIIGPSGSGKSTLLYIAGTLESPTSGSVMLDHTDPFRLDERALATFRNRQIGFVFQDHLLLPQLSVLENVLAPTMVGSADFSADARARALLDQVGLTDRLDQRPDTLSGGERQRVALARALIREPPVLLCDEPTGNLDEESAETVVSLLLELHQRLRTILIIVTHNVGLAARCPLQLRLSRHTLEPCRPSA